MDDGGGAGAFVIATGMFALGMKAAARPFVADDDDDVDVGGGDAPRLRAPPRYALRYPPPAPTGGFGPVGGSGVMVRLLPLLTASPAPGCSESVAPKFLLDSSEGRYFK